MEFIDIDNNWAVIWSVLMNRNAYLIIILAQTATSKNLLPP